MGRLTQMMAYLNAEPKELQEHISMGSFTHFEITEEAKTIRREFRKK
mgnify:CR=1 FL=1